MKNVENRVAWVLQEIDDCCQRALSTSGNDDLSNAAVVFLLEEVVKGIRSLANQLPREPARYTLCSQCGTSFFDHRKGYTRKYCREACRSKAYRDRLRKSTSLTPA